MNIKCFPQNAILSALLTLAINTAFCLGSVLLGTLVFKDYGWLLFVGLPFVLGLTTVFLHGMRGRRDFLQFFSLGSATMVTLFVALMAFPIEGAGCLMMAAPLWFGVMVSGVATGFAIHLVMWTPSREFHGFPLAALALMCLMPMLMGAESLADPEPPVVAVTTVVEIDAPPDVVWANVISFPALQTPGDWVFKLGAAYPLRAEIVGHGVGAVRHCVFSTGAFIEPITKWEEGRLLAFDVTHCPPSMQEWSLYENLHPPHLDGYFVSRRGQFELTPLPGGRTRLAGTTWYQNHMSPQPYWQLWSNAIIHRIHGNVLAHIKKLSEDQVKREAPLAQY